MGTALTKMMRHGSTPMGRRTGSRMFGIVTETWNPVSGCLHGCVYCWARRLAETRLRHVPRYREGFVPRLNEVEFRRRFRPGSVVFVVDMGDLWGEWVPAEWIRRVLDHARRFPWATFVFLTKNPARYREFINDMPSNAILGATIETNRDELAARLSKAPPPSQRYKAMKELEWPRKLVSVEPILDFDLDVLVEWIVEIRPWLVYIGYDNYGHRLPEPPLSKTLELVDRLREHGVRVEPKTLRRAWYEAAERELATGV